MVYCPYNKATSATLWQVGMGKTPSGVFKQMINPESTSSQNMASSDYRGAKNSQTSKNRLQNTTKSFAQVTKNGTQFPKKDQAIIIHPLDGISLKDYIKTIGNAIQAANILSASHISNDRTCIYLKNKNIVDSVVNRVSAIELNSNKLQIRLLINPAQRIILSKVSPTIPHSLIERPLTDIGLKVVSRMKFLRADMHEDEYAHILSFWRQIFISKDEKTQIPKSTSIEHNETNYRIFLSDADDGAHCYACKGKGHLASKCPQPVSTNKSQTENNNTVNRETVTTEQKQATKRSAETESEEENLEMPAMSQLMDTQSPPPNSAGK